MKYSKIRSYLIPFRVLFCHHPQSREASGGMGFRIFELSLLERGSFGTIS
jgi:hypothetical protein